jgi:phage baseplate assembly protein W
MGSIVFNAGFNQELRDENGFKFKDLDVPVKIDEVNFDLKPLIDLNSIRNSIRAIFSWRKGERVLNPEFGNPLYEYIGEPMNEETSKNIGNALITALNKWEPRVSVIKIQVDANEDQNEYRITLTYSVPSMDIEPQTYSNVVPAS